MDSVRFTSKICCRCKIEKEAFEFNTRVCRGRIYLTGPCKPCAVIIASEWNARNRERFNQNVRNHYARKKAQ